ncbi:potassium transporter KefB [Desulfocarbo indianensis]|nr:potassium transporter KefB [Desulfocarbo indianensis]
MHYPILVDLTIVMALAVAAVYLCSLLKIPSIVGFLITGILAGPHGLGLVEASAQIEVLAEVGVVLLLFIIGMEFSFSSFKQMKKTLLVGGGLQVGLSILLAGGLGYLFLGRGAGQALFDGFLVALSSTAIVLNLLQSRGELDAPHGRAGLGILIFQDIAVIPMLLVAPLLAGGAAAGGQSGWVLLAKGAAVIALVGAAARWLVPWALERAVATRNRELFLIAVVLICFGVAWLTASAGLSLALGAFLAGLIISESPYSHQAVSNVLPLRDLFVSVFFVSIGMLMDVSFLLANIWLVPLAAILVLLIKTLAGGLATLTLGLPLRVAVAAGLGLAQIGEFSFVLAHTGITHGLLSPENYQIFLNISVLTMLLTPACLTLGSRLAAHLTTMPPRLPDEAHSPRHLSGHAIVVGYGINGRNVARAARLAGIPYVVAEMNSATVRQEKEKGEPLVYGDATHEPFLEYLGVAKARVLVVAIADPVATRRVVAAAKSLNPGLYLIARTRFLQEVEELAKLGADEVIPEEYETALEIFARLLRRFLVPQSEIERFVNELRSESYCMLRAPEPAGDTAGELSRLLSDVQLITLRVVAGSAAENRKLGELELRRQHGVTMLAVGRGAEVLAEPGAGTQLLAGDLAVLIGTPERLAAARGLFRAA